MKRILSIMITALILTSPVFAAQDDELMEKIKLLEQQIQELKELKEQQKVGVAKQEQCIRAVGREKFCTCLGENLPREVSFEQYIHTIVTPKDALGYPGMTADQKKTVDATIAVRDKCVEKGFFK
ncbi:MAG: hypothetical protein V1791_02730 [Pseudomonadota bacterium]